MVYGSLVNSISGSTADKPEVGMGVTFLLWSDRHAGTIVSVSKDGKTIEVTRDTAKRVDSNGMSDSQSYEFTTNWDGARSTFTLRKNGAWVKKGEGFKNGYRVAVGYRSEYYDFTF